MKKIILNAILLLAIFYTHAQEITKGITKDTTDLNELINIPYKKDSGKIITYRNVNKLLGKYQYQIGGAGVKDGKSIAHSAVLDEKSLTINASFKPFINRMLFIQPRLAMAGADNFISIVSKNKFNKIYTGGINLIAFRRASIFVEEKEVMPIHNSLRVARADFAMNFKKTKIEWDALVEETKKLLSDSMLTSSKVYDYFNNQYFVFDSVLTNTTEQLKNIEKIKANIKKLVELKIITDDIANGNSESIINSLKQIEKKHIISDLIIKEYVRVTDSIQLDIKAKKAINWVSGGINFNSQNQPVILNNSSTSPTTFRNEYYTLNFSFNRQIIKTENNFILSLNLSFSNSRNFDEDNKKTVNFQSPTILGGVSAQSIDSTISFFSNVPVRLNTWNIEVPFIWYNKITNYGLDFAFRTGINNVNDNNVGARVGLFVPISKNDDGVVLIEPLIRLSNLFNNSANKFWKDNFSVGINLSVSLPKLIK